MCSRTGTDPDRAIGSGRRRHVRGAIEAGAEDIQPPPTSEDNSDEDADRIWTVLSKPTEFQVVKDGLERVGFKIVEAELALVPSTSVEVGVEQARSIIRLIDALDDNDDVQKVYHNGLIPDEAFEG
ncbi:MAG: YebC/PmpR family DNA-binding transcriptional regulator [Phycisphaeraceae bacterium]|nr:YebC/PmpR family DNA-binding transcriptional regulator [Phycisphaeraceae bacterium]